MLIECCDKYYDNLAADFPDRHSYGNSIHSVDDKDLIRELKYRIPRFHADNYWQGTPKRKLGQQKKDPYALLDYIEFMALHIKTITSFQRYNEIILSEISFLMNLPTQHSLILEKRSIEFLI